jgi:hypothetical protein
MARFKLKEGRHIGPDPAFKRTKEGKFVNKEGVVVDAAPSVTYGQGEAGGIFVEDDTDLVARFGPEKFEAVEDKSKAKKATPAKKKGEEVEVPMVPEGFKPGARTAVAPNGQVAEGFQVSTSTSDGRTISGAMTERSTPRTAEEKKSDPDRSATIQTGTGLHHMKADPHADDSGAKKAAEDRRAKLEEKTVPELRELAQRKGVAVPSGATKADIIDALEEHHK